MAEEDIVQRVKIVVEDVSFDKAIGDATKKLETGLQKSVSAYSPSVKVNFSDLDKFNKSIGATTKSVGTSTKAIDGVTTALSALNAVGTAAVTKQLANAGNATKTLVTQTKQAVVEQKNLNKAISATTVAPPKVPLERDPNTGQTLPRGVKAPPRRGTPEAAGFDEAAFKKQVAEARAEREKAKTEAARAKAAAPIVPRAPLERDPVTKRFLPRAAPPPPDLRQVKPPAPPPPVVLPRRKPPTMPPPDPLIDDPLKMAWEAELRKRAAVAARNLSSGAPPTNRASQFAAGVNRNAFGVVIPPPPPKPPKPPPPPPGGGGGGGGGSGPFNQLRNAIGSLNPALSLARGNFGTLATVLTSGTTGAAAFAGAIVGLIYAFEKAGDAANDAAQRLGSFTGGAAKGKEAFTQLQGLSKTLQVSATGLAPAMEQIARVSKGDIALPDQAAILKNLVTATQADRVPEDTANKALTQFLSVVEKTGQATEESLKALGEASPTLEKLLREGIERAFPGRLATGSTPAATVLDVAKSPAFGAKAEAEKAQSVKEFGTGISTSFNALKAAAENLATTLSGGDIVSKTLLALASYLDKYNEAFKLLKKKRDELPETESGAPKELPPKSIFGRVAAAAYEPRGPKPPDPKTVFDPSRNEPRISDSVLAAAEEKAGSAAVAAAAGIDAFATSADLAGAAADRAAAATEKAAKKEDTIPKQLAAHSALLNKAQAELEHRYLPRQQEIQTARNELNVQRADIAVTSAQIGIKEAQKQQALAGLAVPQAQLATDQARQSLEQIELQRIQTRAARQGIDATQDPEFMARKNRAEDEALDLQEKQARLALQRAQIEEKYAHLEAPKAKLAAEQAQIALKSAEIEKADASLTLAKDKEGQPIARDLAALNYAQATLDATNKLNEINKNQLTTLKDILNALKGTQSDKEKQIEDKATQDRGGATPGDGGGSGGATYDPKTGVTTIGWNATQQDINNALSKASGGASVSQPPQQTDGVRTVGWEKGGAQPGVAPGSFGGVFDTPTTLIQQAAYWEAITGQSLKATAENTKALADNNKATVQNTRTIDGSVAVPTNIPERARDTAQSPRGGLLTGQPLDLSGIKSDTPLTDPRFGKAVEKFKQYGRSLQEADAEAAKTLKDVADRLKKDPKQQRPAGFTNEIEDRLNEALGRQPPSRVREFERQDKKVEELSKQPFGGPTDPQVAAGKARRENYREALAQFDAASGDLSKLNSETIDTLNKLSTSPDKRFRTSTTDPIAKRLPELKTAFEKLGPEELEKAQIDNDKTINSALESFKKFRGALPDKDPKAFETLKKLHDLHSGDIPREFLNAAGLPDKPFYGGPGSDAQDQIRRMIQAREKRPDLTKAIGDRGAMTDMALNQFRQFGQELPTKDPESARILKNLSDKQGGADISGLAPQLQDSLRQMIQQVGDQFRGGVPTPQDRPDFEGAKTAADQLAASLNAAKVATDAQTQATQQATQSTQANVQATDASTQATSQSSQTELAAAYESLSSGAETSGTSLDQTSSSAEQVASSLSGLDSAIAATAAAFAEAQGAAQAAGSGNSPSGGSHALGGPIYGAGTSTSDSIPAWLSHGEFVQSAKATRYWGTDFMRAINSLKMPKFYAGGFASKASFAGLMDFGLPRAYPGNLGNLHSGQKISMEQLGTVDLRTDYGSVQMQGTKSAMDQLSKMAVTKRITSTGRKPGFIG